MFITSTVLLKKYMHNPRTVKCTIVCFPLCGHGRFYRFEFKCSVRFESTERFRTASCTGSFQMRELTLLTSISAQSTQWYRILLVGWPVGESPPFAYCSFEEFVSVDMES